MLLPSRCLLAQTGDLHRDLVTRLAGGEALALDASGLAEVDVSFLQLLASASLTGGAALTVSGLTDRVRSTFRRAGLDVCPETGTLSQA